jgi:hypothetical protein
VADGAALVVDEGTRERLDVEKSLADGPILFVHSDCAGVRVVPGCTIPPGYLFKVGYTYRAVTPKEEVVRMEEADAVRARLPGLADTLGASLTRGMALDLALVVAGEYSAMAVRLNETAPQPLTTVYGGDLPRECKDATHFVRAAHTGAFALSTSTKADVRAAAQIFASAESASTATHARKDGRIEACTTAAGAARPAEGCNAPVRLVLAKLDPRSSAQGVCEDGTGELRVDRCIDWASDVWQRERDPQAEVLFAKLASLCGEGWRRACNSAIVRARDTKDGRLHELETSACRAGLSSYCETNAKALLDAGKSDEALAMLDLGCRGDGARSCAQLAELLDRGVGRDPQKKESALVARARACKFGPNEACTAFARARRAGARLRPADFGGFTVEVARCEQGAKRACLSAAAAYAFGLGAPRDVTHAKKHWSSYCEAMERKDGCAFPKDWE